ncbi:hypothetical protein BHM03_00018800 [Ensete ventricosum]|uniref:Uncharacterized protein n=1 Tax=Ensete ventricosum TaxID=4639 RepID=A0A445MFE5_ENSVE|nr:hypothetical protein BHM03_00018800 [Ensete ventricosum]
MVRRRSSSPTGHPCCTWPCPDDCGLYARSLSRSLHPSRPPGPNLQVWRLHTCFRCPTAASAPPTAVPAPCRTSFCSTHYKLFSLHRFKIDVLDRSSILRGHDSS